MIPWLSHHALNMTFLWKKFISRLKRRSVFWIHPLIKLLKNMIKNPLLITINKPVQQGHMKLSCMHNFNLHEIGDSLEAGRARFIFLPVKSFQFFSIHIWMPYNIRFLSEIPNPMNRDLSNNFPLVCPLD